jgi:hypothetical protein
LVTTGSSRLLSPFAFQLDTLDISHGDIPLARQTPDEAFFYRVAPMRCL